MQCPLCKVDLQMTVRNDVEIDYCPKCRGVWLDRGELDKLIEIAKTTNSGMNSSQVVNPVNPPTQTQIPPSHTHTHPQTGSHRKRENIFEEIFDIF